MKTGSTEELTVDAFLQRFLPFARRRIETAQAQDGQYLRPSDPAYEQVLDSLAMVARHTPAPLLEALVRWRESESPKGANDASTFQRKLAVECIFCSACIRVVECCPQEGLTEKLWAGLENFVFDWPINADRVVSQVEYPSLVDLRGIVLDLVAQLLGALSRIRFRSVTKRFFMELNTRRIDTSVARSETLFIINGMRYLKLEVKTEGGLDASASFVAKANPLNRAPHKRKSELYNALCNMLSNILAPLADGGKSQWPPSGVDRALALWYEAIGQIRGQLMNWMDKQSRHIAVGYPLVTLLLCLGDLHIFRCNLTPHMEQLFKLLRGKNHRFMALDCLYRVLRFYLSVHAANLPINRTLDYIDIVTCELLTVLRKGKLTQDVQHDKLVEFCVTIAEHDLDFAVNHMILELLKQDSLSEAKVIGLRAWRAIEMLPSSQHVGLEIFKGHQIGHYIPKVNAAIELISSTTIGHQGITLPEILSASGNFHIAYLIAEGGSAKVYKGELRGKLVAIKKLKPESDETEPMETKYFGIEVAALGICEHPNIVKMIGYYMDEKERIIVSEYVARGSLYSLLHDRSLDDPILDWNTRLRIALDIASGMTYLHDNLHIIHRDLKAQNILLDEHLRAKVADLGIVKSRAYNDGDVYTKLIGTRGYLCPHYVATGSVGTYSDVYAFGVILLELISGRKALDNYTLLADWARTIMQNGSHLGLFDHHLVGEIKESVLNNVAMLATKCVALRKEDRPSMGQIHYELLSMTQM